MLCVRAPKLENRLDKLSKLTGKTKSYYVRTALEIFLDEYQESQLPSLEAFEIPT